MMFRNTFGVVPVLSNYFTNITIKKKKRSRFRFTKANKNALEASAIKNARYKKLADTIESLVAFLTRLDAYIELPSSLSFGYRLSPTDD